MLNNAEPASVPTTPKSQGATTALEVIAKRGDVILQVGEDEEATSCLLVSSVALSLASPVFEAMFDGNFSEGHSLSTNSLQTIPLPDDNPESMRILCLIIHMQTGNLLSSLPPADLADFAVICDKYDCANAVQAWTRIWVMELLPHPNAVDFEKILFATYVLDMAKEFNEVTRNIIRERVKSISIVATAHGHNFLPMSLFDKLLQEVELCREKSMATFPAVTSTLIGCSKLQGTLGNFVSCLRTAKIWPFGNTSLKQLLSRAMEMEETQDSSAKCDCNGTCYHYQEGNALKTRLTQKLNGVYNSIHGLCLDCIRREELGDARPCRIEHETPPKLRVVRKNAN